ncbi:MAG TPA: hypothetical protein VNG33_21320, partial [Polyangiaceae bacterium]|nr:hypothetical protein [Polyangiaceae bacterium]
QLTMCRETCQSIMRQPLEFCEPLCGDRLALRLEAGASVQADWNGTFDVATTLPPGCSRYDGPVSCPVQRHFRPGKYVFSAHAGTSLACPQAPCPSDCVPDADGSCEAWDVDVGGDPMLATLEVALDPGGKDGTGLHEALNLVFHAP